MQATARRPYPTRFALVPVFVAAFLSACIANSAGCADQGRLHIIKTIVENPGAIRLASTIDIALNFDFGDLGPTDDTAAEQLKNIGSGLCHVFGDALKPVLPNARFQYHLRWPYSRGPVRSRSSYVGPTEDLRTPPDVILGISFVIRFHKNTTILEEGPIRFRPQKIFEDLPRPKPHHRVFKERWLWKHFYRGEDWEEDWEELRRSHPIRTVKGALWQATQKLPTTLEVSTKRGGWFGLSGGWEVDPAQLGRALRAWGKVRAVEVANELAIALRAEAAHE